jgi:NAD(P)-dependent dehydrogenase (short-subunit alcohol dehydrogenase family)
VCTQRYKRVVPRVTELFDLTGRVAVVTGASRGLGREMAEGLAEAGAHVVICARRVDWLDPTVAEMRAAGCRVESVRCDVADASQVQALVDFTLARCGRIDILVNNAGVSWGAEPDAMPLEQWHRVLNANLTGAFLCSQAVGRHMLTRQSGNIINIASVAGLQGLVNGPHYAGYAASKAGLLGLTRELAATWGRHGIRVNAIAPGFFHSRLADPIIPLAEPAIRASNPIPRIGLPGELKGVCVFLASDASSYMTGQTLVVDGGGTTS